METDTQLVLSLCPNARGIGYACVEMPQKLIDSGVLTIRPICNGKILERVKKFIEFYKPQLIIVKDYDKSSYRSKRGIELVEAITAYATQINVPVTRYTRQQIQNVFELFGAKSKYEIAQKIIIPFPQLATRAPKLRKPWMAEDYYMGEFDAIALALTHEYLTQ